MSKNHYFLSDPARRFVSSGKEILTRKFYSDDTIRFPLKTYRVFGKIYTEDVQYVIYDSGHTYYLLRLLCNGVSAYDWKHRSVEFSETSIDKKTGTQSYFPDVKFSDLELTVRANTMLSRSGIDSMRKLLAVSQEELANIPGIGKATIQVIVDALSVHGLSLK